MANYENQISNKPFREIGNPTDGVDNLFTMYDSPIEVAEDVFEPILQGVSLKELAKTLKDQFEGNLIAFDPMGQGSRMVTIGATRTLAVSLDFDRNRLQKDVDRTSITQLAGRLQDKETWEKVYDWVRENGSFGLIICTPGDGLKFFWNPEISSPEKNLELFTIFVRQLVSTLSVGGILFLESQAEVRMISRYINSKSYTQLPYPVRIEFNCVLSLLKIIRLDSGENNVVTEV